MSSLFQRRTTLLIACTSLLAAGCTERRARAYPWATTMNIRPHLPPPSPREAVPLPDLAVSIPPAMPLSRLAPGRSPARPRVAAPQQQEPPGATHAAAPSLAPQLSEQEVAAAQQQFNESSAAAERNLAAAGGHKLNATQADLASKVTTFLQEAKEAAKDGDWTRARNLARKAQVLSDELASSL